jgi:site-specific DNA recombinase
MIAACYARKSQENEENVAAQVAAARAFATARGWTIPDQHVYQDDGISGSVFGEGRPGLAALMAAVASPARGFGVLIVRDVDRIGRELWEIGRTLQTIVEAGVLVWFYQTNQELTLDSPISKVMLSLQGFSAEDYRDKVVKNTRAALRERATDGKVPGGKLFGYRNVRPAPKARVTRVIDEDEKKIVIGIFEAYAKGLGLHTIALQLNADHMKSSRPQGWSQGGVAGILRNPHYIGKVVYGKKITVARTGKKQKVLRATNPSTWITVEQPDLRVIPQALWDRVQKQREARGGPRGPHGRLMGRDSKQEIVSAYLLTGSAICQECGGSIRITVRGVGHKAGRRYTPNYGCAAFETRGTCKNNVVVPSREVEAAVVARISRYLDQDIMEPAVDRALARMVEQRGPGPDRRQHLAGEIAKLAQRGARLAAAISEGGELAPLVNEIKQVEARKAEAEAEITALVDDAAPVDPREVKRALVAYGRDIKGLLAGTPGQARVVLRQLLRGKITMAPFRTNGTRGYRFSGELAINRLLEGDARASAQTRAGTCARGSGPTASASSCARGNRARAGSPTGRPGSRP